MTNVTNIREFLRLNVFPPNGKIWHEDPIIVTMNNN